MKTDPGWLAVRLGGDDSDLRAAQRLRYRVFVQELGGDGPMVDHEAGLERDEFDAMVDHLMLVDTRRDPAAGDHVIGAYRLLRSDVAERFGRYYSESEYDLSPLKASGRRLVELGRSCVDPAFRGGSGMFLLWNALADYVLDNRIDILFGVASFHGTDVAPLAQALSWLHHRHLAPPELRPVARPPHFQRMDLVAPESLNRQAAIAAMPALIKAYLRLGGVVGEGAWLDHDFNTTDVFLLMDTAAMSDRHRRYYQDRWQGA
ncbi:GNAT family N-acetyltransferase [Paracoccus sp. MC1862]|uniref:GNAT family N-acetyltransferase n=1 Tax=Paracoccus sp. MC1862 TaxID=2760307 RepID=UPI001601098E|nr:GNAT family N-acyltransferase [Paracoccus sp. MC1862]MBB1498637.1 GNAT family N-acetyltransferase [Paracoccus sp. MC1862]QQO46148.1 GNAT family N-acetyltransferase [Paracoccus sp. MC1862]